MPCGTINPSLSDVLIGARFKPYGLYSGFGVKGDDIANAIVPASVLMEELPAYLEDIRLCHDTWKKRQQIYNRLKESAKE